MGPTAPCGAFRSNLALLALVANLALLALVADLALLALVADLALLTLVTHLALLALGARGTGRSCWPGGPASEVNRSVKKINVFR